MPRWLERVENRVGEWSVTDLRLDYRVCAYNREAHGGVHVHHPIHGEPVGTVPLRDPWAAERVVRAFAAGHDAFALDAFAEVIEEWRSGSSGD